MMQAQPDGTTLWALFHIGFGNGGSVQYCTGGAAGESQVVSAAGTPSAMGSILHVSSSPYGPFVPAAPLPSCNNPSPFLF